MNSDRGNFVLPPFNFDEHELSDTTLSQGRGAPVEGEGVRISVAAKSPVVGVKPRSCRELDDPGTKLVAQFHPGEARPSVIEDLDHIAVVKAPGASVVGVHPDGFSPPHL